MPHNAARAKPHIECINETEVLLRLHNFQICCENEKEFLLQTFPRIVHNATENVEHSIRFSTFEQSATFPR